MLCLRLKMFYLGRVRVFRRRPIKNRRLGHPLGCRLLQLDRHRRRHRHRRRRHRLYIPKPPAGVVEIRGVFIGVLLSPAEVCYLYLTFYGSALSNEGLRVQLLMIPWGSISQGGS